MSFVDSSTVKNVVKLKKKIKNLLNNEYTEFHTDVQLDKNQEYSIRIYTKGAESGKEPIVYQWSTRENGFIGKMHLNQMQQEKYLVSAAFYF